MGENRMVSFSLGGMAFEYDDNKNQINIKHLRAQLVSFLTMTELNFTMRIIAMAKIGIIQ